MPKRLTLISHLLPEEIYAHYRRAKSGVDHSHWQVIWLFAQGYSPKDINTMTGYSVVWIRTIIRRYNQHGPDGLIDQRSYNRGAEPLLNPEQQQKLRRALRKPPSSGTTWTAQKVADWIADELGYAVQVQRGWDYLRRFGGARYRGSKQQARRLVIKSKPRRKTFRR